MVPQQYNRAVPLPGQTGFEDFWVAIDKGLCYHITVLHTASESLDAIRQDPNKEKIIEEVIMELREKVEGALQKVRPSLQADGGDVQLVDVGDDGVVKVKLMGACGGCPMSQMTLKNGIEKILKESVPEVHSVESA